MTYREEVDVFHGIPVQYEVTPFRLNQYEIDVILNKEFFHPVRNDLTKTSFLLNDSRLQRVKNFLDERMKNYIENVVEIENEFVMTQSWSTITKKGENHHSHSHHNSIFSLVFYVSSEGEKSGNLVFDFGHSRLMERMNFTYDVKNYNGFNAGEWDYVVNTGDIVLFPSWVRHQTRENTSDKDRIIIGANYFINGIVGTTKGVNKIGIELGNLEDSDDAIPHSKVGIELGDLKDD